MLVMESCDPPSHKTNRPGEPEGLARRVNRSSIQLDDRASSQTAHKTVRGFAMKLHLALVFLYFLEVGIDHIVLRLARATG